MCNPNSTLGVCKLHFVSRIYKRYPLRVHKTAVLNSTLNSTFVLGYALDVATVNLTMATAWSDEVEETYLAMEAAIEQVEKTLQQVQCNRKDYNAYRVLAQTSMAEARSARDNHSVRTLALQHANTSITVQTLVKHQVNAWWQGKIRTGIL